MLQLKLDTEHPCYMDKCEYIQQLNGGLEEPPFFNLLKNFTFVHLLMYFSFFCFLQFFMFSNLILSPCSYTSPQPLQVISLVYNHKKNENKQPPMG